MLCAAMSDPFQGSNYRIFACCHQALLCPLLSKGTVVLFGRRNRSSSGLTGSGSMPEPRGEAAQYHQLTQDDYAMQEEAILRHRFSNQEAVDDGHPHDAGEMASLTAEYTMPTTKID